MKKRQVINISKFEKAYFNIGSNEYYEGYHIKDNRWNGFATPCFEKEIADAISHNCSTSDYKISYDKSKDSYIVKMYEGRKIVETYLFEKSVIDTPDGKKEVYAMGAYYWTWHAYSFDKVREDPNANIISNNAEVNKEDSIDMDY